MSGVCNGCWVSGIWVCCVICCLWSVFVECRLGVRWVVGGVLGSWCVVCCVGDTWFVGEVCSVRL